MILPKSLPNSDPSWFGFLMAWDANVDQKKMVRYIESEGVQTRMLFTDNIIKYPYFNNMRTEKKEYRTVGNLSITYRIMNDRF